MKKILVSIIIVLLVLLGVVWVSFLRAGKDQLIEQAVETPAKQPSIEESPQAKAAAEKKKEPLSETLEKLAKQREQARAVSGPTDSLRSIYDQEIEALQELQNLALKEGAEETAERLGELIAKKREQFEERLKAQQKVRDRIKRIRRRRPGVSERVRPTMPAE